MYGLLVRPSPSEYSLLLLLQNCPVLFEMTGEFRTPAPTVPASAESVDPALTLDNCSQSEGANGVTLVQS